VSPLIIYEDEHLLVVNKPAGLNTHAPSPFAGEGLYDWLRHREPRWANLAIIHRLDKETSGVMVFSKTPLANRSLTEQFTKRAVHKRYVLLTDRPVPENEITVRSTVVRAGERYLSRPPHAGVDVAETRFRKMDLEPSPTPGSEAIKVETHSEESICAEPNQNQLSRLEAEPLTGRTHQIRVHAAERGFPVLGDTLYGGTAASRVYLHALELKFKHPARQDEAVFRAPPEFGCDPRWELRRGLLELAQTNAFRLIHGASDGWAGWYVDRCGDYLLSQSEQTLANEQTGKIEGLVQRFAVRGAYHKLLSRQVRKTSLAGASPRLVLGAPAPERFEVLENGLKFELSFNEGYSVGLFLDQRENRRRLLTSHVAAGFPLFGTKNGGGAPEVFNAFAYTCGFSVCAAKAGARVTSLDLSRKYLDWGKRNFVLNQLDPASHDFIYGDVFDWLRRLAKKGRRFDVILLDPPTFSQSKSSGTWRVQKDYPRLAVAAITLLEPGGVLFASSNAADWPPAEFMGVLEEALGKCGRNADAIHYVPQPIDFPISRAEPGYLKTAWFRTA
jgi:23S rRNA (cytosine1962-C5)-methyltransferase